MPASPKKSAIIHPSSEANDPSSSQDHTKKKSSSSYYTFIKRTATGPLAPGSKTIPQGSPNCLAGLTFVFTGEMESMTREEGQDLVKRYGGRVTTTPSGKTNYLVAGEGAGDAKLAKAEAIGIKVIDEDKLLAMIAANPKNDSIIQGETSQMKEEPLKRPAAIKSKTLPAKKAKIEDKIQAAEDKEDLWTTKYAPHDSSELVGNHTAYESLVKWLKDWTPQTEYHAALLAGPPGIGKTTMAQLAAKEVGLECLELNASDTRNKSSLHVHLLN